MSPSNPMHKRIKELESAPMRTMQRFPRLTAHLICESLGYFTPKAAANAITKHRENEAFFCEWYSHQAVCRKENAFDREAVLEIGRDTIRNAFRNRHHHQGYMSEYKQAKQLVDRALQDNIHPELTSWF